MSKLAYVQGHNAAVLRSHESRNAENTCGFFLPHLKSDSKVLDAGCGPGTVTASMAALIPEGQVTGVDAAESVIGKARAQPDLPSNCSFDVADVTALHFADDTFDIVYTSQVLCHIPQAAKAMSELRRVCKPGGIVACREGDFPAVIIYPHNPPLEQWKQAMIDVMVKKECFPDGGRHLVEWALQAGFAPDSITYTGGAVAYTGSQRKFWGEAMMARLAGDPTWREHVLNLGLATEADFGAMSEGWVKWMEADAAVFAMPCGQAVCQK